jgi:hypothetical protein
MMTISGMPIDPNIFSLVREFSRKWFKRL